MDIHNDIKRYRSMVTLLNWTDEEIKQLDKINVNWIMTDQISHNHENIKMEQK